jgi:hypothetical protein
MKQQTQALGFFHYDIAGLFRSYELMPAESMRRCSARFSVRDLTAEGHTGRAIIEVRHGGARADCHKFYF